MRVVHELTDNRQGRNSETRDSPTSASADVMGYLPIYKKADGVSMAEKQPPHHDA